MGILTEQKKKRKKSGGAAHCPFRFLFGLRKGNRVWDSVPVLQFKSRENKANKLVA